MKVAVFEVHDYEDDDFALAPSYGLEIQTCREILSRKNLSLVQGCKGVSVLGHSILDAQILTELKKAGVRFIATRTIGYNHIDMKAAQALKLRVSNAQYSPHNVADFTVMLMLMLLRKAKIPVIRALVNDFSLDDMRGKELRSCTVGIVGAGKIGRAVMQNLSGFGCKILVYDPFAENIALPEGAKQASLDEILTTCDILSLHIPFTEDNRHFLDGGRLNKMKRGALLINTARGELVDTEALICAVESGQIGGVAIDTVEDEENICHVDLGTRVVPKRDLFYLKQFPNVIYTPHLAFFTEEATSAMVQSALESLKLFDENRPNPYEIIP